MRDIPAALKEHLSGRVTRAIALVFVDIETDPVRLHNDVGDIAWGGHTWGGAGELGRIDPVDEDDALSPDAYALTLGGLDDDLLADLRSQRHVGRDVCIWIAARDLATGALVGEPMPVLRGIVEDATAVGGGRAGAISLQVADERTLLGRAGGILLDDGQQRVRHPGDGFFQHVAFVGEREVIWGPDGGAAKWPRHDYDDDDSGEELWQ